MFFKIHGKPLEKKSMYSSIVLIDRIDEICR